MGPDFDRETFLREYWQKQPLVIPNVAVNLATLPSANELAGLALEEEVESRIISCDKGVWQLEHGPFSAEAYDRGDQWTLLVQKVDHYLPEVASLRNLVNFLPRWRFDDVMVSYAVDGGGVGPHFDRYDVFLLQGAGHRRWRLGQFCDDQTPLQAHRDLSLLADFHVTEEYVLEPGDVLYVPPGRAHWGIAEGECITYSLGFRAASMADVMARRVDQALEQLDTTLLLEDGDSMDSGQRPGEITARQLDNARTAFSNALTALDDGSWLGRLVTETGENAVESDAEGLSINSVVQLSPSARVAWRECNTELEVYCFGEAFSAPLACCPLLMRLCQGDWISLTDASQLERVLLDQLDTLGALITG